MDTIGNIITTIAENPNTFGVAVFVVVFLPLLFYVIRWAEKTTNENRRYRDWETDRKSVV